MKKRVDINTKIIKSAIEGQRAAQKALYDQYNISMFNTCMRMMKSREEAEDVLQEAFIDAFKRLHTFRFESTFGAWIKRIVVNHCINALKKKRLDIDLEKEMGNIELEEESISEGEEFHFNVAMVHKAMNSLPTASRTVFSLYLFEGYDHVEIAQILGVTTSTSKTHYMNAKRKIKSQLTTNWMNYDKRQN